MLKLEEEIPVFRIPNAGCISRNRYNALFSRIEPRPVNLTLMFHRTGQERARFVSQTRTALPDAVTTRLPSELKAA